MAAFNGFESFSEELSEGTHNFEAAGDTLNIYLSNTAPNAATHAVKADIAEIATGNGYTGPQDVQNDTSRSAAVTSITGVDVVITASGGTIGPFRYLILYNDTPTSPVDPLIGWWDYGSGLTLNDGDSFTVDFGASVFTVTSP